MVFLDTYDRLVRRRLHLQGVRSHYRVLDGRRVHYYELEGTGSGPALVLLHGLGGNANSFQAVLSGLRRGWKRIYAPDLPGHGFTPLDAQAFLDVRGHGTLAFRFIEQVVREPVGLVGNSMGGALAMGIAVEKPEWVRALGLLAPAGAPLTDEHLLDLRTRFRPGSRRDAMAFIQRLTHRPMYAAMLAASDIREMLGSPALQHILATTTPHDRLNEEALRGLPIPVLLVWGASEKVLPPGGLEYFRAHLPPHAEIVVLPRCGHLPQVEHPRKTVELLNGLAARVTALV